MGMITRGQLLFINQLRAAQAFRHILPRHLHMHAAGVGALALMHGEEAAHLGQDAVERPGFIAGR